MYVKFCFQLSNGLSMFVLVLMPLQHMLAEDHEATLCILCDTIALGQSNNILLSDNSKEHCIDKSGFIIKMVMHIAASAALREISPLNKVYFECLGRGSASPIPIDYRNS